jgi:hypothetical protein
VGDVCTGWLGAFLIHFCFFGRDFFLFCLAFSLSPRSSCESAFERGSGVLGICVERPLVLVNGARQLDLHSGGWLTARSAQVASWETADAVARGSGHIFVPAEMLPRECHARIARHPCGGCARVRWIDTRPPSVPGEPGVGPIGVSAVIIFSYQVHTYMPETLFLVPVLSYRTECNDRSQSPFVCSAETTIYGSPVISRLATAERLITIHGNAGIKQTMLKF